jgi:hypothetical protein
MFKKITCYQLICDRCGALLEEPMEGDSAFVDEESAEMCANEAGWKHIGKNWYCQDCVEFDEDSDEYKPKPKEK